MTLTTQTSQEIANYIISKLIENNEEITDYNIGSVLRTIIEALANQIGLDGDENNIYTQLQNVYNATRITTAIGDDLDQLGALVAVNRFDGDKSSGNVTFIRQTEGTSNITIPVGTQVGTSPADEGGQKIFTSTANTTYYYNIIGESHKFYDGVFYYPLNQRFFNTITQLSGTSGGSGYVFSNNVDYKISSYDNYFIDTTVAPIEVDNCESLKAWVSNELDTVDSCDATTGWTASTDGAIILNITSGEYKEGTGCLNIQKTGTTVTNVLYDKTLSVAYNLNNNEINFWYYIDDATELAKLSSVEVRVGSNNSNYYYVNYLSTSITTGWNRLRINLNNSSIVGAPTANNIVYVGVNVSVHNTTDTITSNKQRLDYLHIFTLPELDTSDKMQGTASLKLIKQSNIEDIIYFDQLLTSTIDAQNKNLSLWIKIKDDTTLNKITKIELYLGNNNASVSQYYTLNKSDLSVGWKQYYLTNQVRMNNPSTGAFNYFRFKIITLNNTDLFALGDIKLDFINLVKLNYWTGNIVEFITTGTRPDNNTNFSTNYKPLSVEVPVEANAIGSLYNVAKNKIVYKVTYISTFDRINNYSAFTGGTDEELDEAYRTRIQQSATSGGRAYVKAIKTAIENVSGVRSVNVIERPLKMELNEAHTYNTGTLNYGLIYDTIVDDSNVEITGTVSSAPYTFIKDIDYVVNESENRIEFLATGTLPDNATQFFVDYSYEWIGHVECYVGGEEYPIGTETSDDIDAAIEDTKGGGIVVTWTEPTTIYVDVVATITINSTTNLTTAKTEAESAITTYLNSLDVGQNVVKNEIVSLIMNVAGVTNCNVSTPTSDLTINENEICRVGSINIT